MRRREFIAGLVGAAAWPLMARWRVDIIRKRAEHLGTVEAPNANEAILEAIKRFELPPERQNRITVEKITKKD
jgi:hypothetical protein